MKYDKLFAIADEYIDLELEMRDKVLTPEQRDEFKAKRIDQNNRMIEIYEHQRTPESKEKYWEFFQNYDDTIGGIRGVHKEIEQLQAQNKALENGWDVSRLYMFLNIQEYTTLCKQVHETLEHFDDPNLIKAKAYTKKVSDLNPTDRKFKSIEEFDKYMTAFHLAFTDLVNEASKPEVNAALNTVCDTVNDTTKEYDKKLAERDF